MRESRVNREGETCVAERLKFGAFHALPDSEIYKTEYYDVIAFMTNLYNI